MEDEGDMLLGIEMLVAILGGGSLKGVRTYEKKDTLEGEEKNYVGDSEDESNYNLREL